MNLQPGSGGAVAPFAVRVTNGVGGPRAGMTNAGNPVGRTTPAERAMSKGCVRRRERKHAVKGHHSATRTPIGKPGTSFAILAASIPPPHQGQKAARSAGGVSHAHLSRPLLPEAVEPANRCRFIESRTSHVLRKPPHSTTGRCFTQAVGIWATMPRDARIFGGRSQHHDLFNHARHQ